MLLAKIHVRQCSFMIVLLTDFLHCNICILLWNKVCASWASWLWHQVSASGQLNKGTLLQADQSLISLSMPKIPLHTFSFIPACYFPLSYCHLLFTLIICNEKILLFLSSATFFPFFMLTFCFVPAFLQYLHLSFFFVVWADFSVLFSVALGLLPKGLVLQKKTEQVRSHMGSSGFSIPCKAFNWYFWIQFFFLWTQLIFRKLYAERFYKLKQQFYCKSVDQ